MIRKKYCVSSALFFFCAVLSVPLRSEACGCSACLPPPTLVLAGTTDPSLLPPLRWTSELLLTGSSAEVHAGRMLNSTQVRSTTTVEGSVGRFSFAAMVPMLYRNAQEGQTPTVEGVGPGDVSLYIRWHLYKGISWPWNVRVTALAGLEVPTAPFVMVYRSDELARSVQTGTGGWTPTVGAEVSAFLRPVYVGAAISGRATAGGFRSWRVGASFDASLSALVQVHPRLLLGGSIDAHGALADSDGEEQVHSSGNLVLSLSPMVLWLLTSEWSLRASVRVPEVVYANGMQRFAPTAMLSLTWTAPLAFSSLAR